MGINNQATLKTMYRFILLLVLVTISLTGYGQSAQTEYLEAKRLFSIKEYGMAKTAFESLAYDKTFGEYAQFYTGLSAYFKGDKYMATSIWDQLLVDKPKWNQAFEVYFWLAKVNFESGNFEKGIVFATRLTEETLQSAQEEEFIKTYINVLDLTEIESLQSIFPSNKYLAEALVTSLNELPYSERDFERINKLVDEFELDLTMLSSNELPDIRKDTFEIAVLLPFLFENLEQTQLITQNKFVMDMYQGMLMAAEDLAAEGKPVNLKPYDTKRKKTVTNNVLALPGFANHDLIVGPLFEGPSEAINEFTKTTLMNRLNPISSNSDAIGDNPFSFLIRPTYETMAKEMAQFAASENDNPNVMVYYERSDRDSLFAVRYKEEIEKAGFNVVRLQVITQENSRNLLDSLWSQYDSYLSQDVVDSLLELEPDKIIRSRRIRKDEIARMERDETFTLPISYDDDDNMIVFYEKEFYMKPDSIGHVMAATRSNLFANNLISAVATRRDSIRLYGYGDWIDFTMLSFSQLENLRVALTHPDYIERGNFSYDVLRRRFFEKYKQAPSINHFRGYETVYFAGRMMHKHGKYFQNGLRSEGIIPAKVFEGFQYGAANDNQLVPIVRFNDAVLEVVNKGFYED